MAIILTLVAIAVAIVALLLSLNPCFTGCSAIPETSCLPIAGYLCQNPTMNTSGSLSIIIGQTNPGTEYNIALSCAQTSNDQGLPVSAGVLNPWYFVDANGTANTQVSNHSPSYVLNLVQQQQVNVTGLQCYQSNGAFDPNTIGAEFTGAIWLNYTSTPTAAVSGNWITMKIASIAIKTI